MTLLQMMAHTQTKEEIMSKGKIVGLALAVLFALPLYVVAEEVTGTVKMIDRADHSLVLSDGTQLTVSDSQIGSLAPGDQVQAMYQTKADKKVVTELNRSPFADRFSPIEAD